MGNNQELETIMKNSPQTRNLNIPPWYRYTTDTILSIIQLSYIMYTGYLVADNLEDSKVLQTTLPLAMIGIVAGVFAIRAGYSKVANGLAKFLYSNSVPSD